MFYKEEDISKELICPKCTNRLENPRILPCGNSLCQSCITDDIEEGAIKKCYCCQEKHPLPKNGEFIQNKFILKQLEKKPIEIELCNKLKKKVIELSKKREELETYMKVRDQIVSDYLNEIRTEIDIITETKIENLNRVRESLLDKLKQCHTEFLLSKLSNQADLLAKIDEFNEKITKYSNVTCKETYDKLNEADKLIDLCSKARINFEKESSSIQTQQSAKRCASSWNVCSYFQNCGYLRCTRPNLLAIVIASVLLAFLILLNQKTFNNAVSDLLHSAQDFVLKTYAKKTA